MQIVDDSLDEVNLDGLVEVGPRAAFPWNGNIDIRGNNITRISLPVLQHVGRIRLHACGTTRVDFGALESVQDLEITDCDALTSLAGFNALRAAVPAGGSALRSSCPAMPRSPISA